MSSHNAANLLSLLVLAGGESSRMGYNKAYLPWRGKTLLTDLLCRSLVVPFSSIIVSANAPIDLTNLPGQLEVIADKSSEKIKEYFWTPPKGESRTLAVIGDTFPHCGPLSGMEAAMRAYPAPRRLVLSVDLPFYDFSALSRFLTSTGAGSYEAIVPVVNGKENPLAAVYTDSVYKKIRAALQSGDYRVRQIYKDAARFVDESAYAHQYVNTNTPVAYKDALAYETNRQLTVPVISVTADKSGTGKTRLCVALIRRLTAQGYAVGYVKSTHHNVSGEKPGSDTWRAKAAGAVSAYIAARADADGPDKSRALLLHAEAMPADVVFIETRSRTVFPAIKVLAPGEAPPPADDGEKITAVVSPEPPPATNDYRCFTPANIREISEYIISLLPAE